MTNALALSEELWRPEPGAALVGLASSHGQGTTSHGPLGQPRLAVPAEREPLRHLQQEGLVTAGNRGMVRVNHLTPVEVRELFRVRAASEGIAVAEITASSERGSGGQAAGGAGTTGRRRRRLRGRARS
jgi:hypothetical protein